MKTSVLGVGVTVLAVGVLAGATAVTWLTPQPRTEADSDAVLRSLAERITLLESLAEANARNAVEPQLPRKEVTDVSAVRLIVAEELNRLLGSGESLSAIESLKRDINRKIDKRDQLNLDASANLAQRINHLAVQVSALERAAGGKR